MISTQALPQSTLKRSPRSKACFPSPRRVRYHANSWYMAFHDVPANCPKLVTEVVASTSECCDVEPPLSSPISAPLLCHWGFRVDGEGGRETMEPSTPELCRSLHHTFTNEIQKEAQYSHKSRDLFLHFLHSDASSFDLSLRGVVPVGLGRSLCLLRCEVGPRGGERVA